MSAASLMNAVDRARSAGRILVEEATMYRVAIPMIEPFRISSGEVREREVMLVRLANRHAFGWGESASMPGTFYSVETPDSSQRELLETLLPAVAGRSFASIIELQSQMAALSSDHFARCAVETAAWELLARERNLPVSALLGVEPRPVRPGLAVGLYDSEGELVAAIRRQRPERYGRLKIKIKRGQDVSLVQAVRREFPEIPLFVDANADYTRDDFAIFEELDGYGLMMFEQPLPRSDMDGSALLQARVRTPICLDESIETAADARRAIEMRACGIVNLKLQRVGGLLEGLRIRDVCRETATPLWMGTMPELGLGLAQALTLAADPAFVLPTDVEPSSRFYPDDILTPAMELDAGGCLSVPDGPGWGYEVDRVKLERYTTARWRV